MYSHLTVGCDLAKGATEAGKRIWLIVSVLGWTWNDCLLLDS